MFPITTCVLVTRETLRLLENCVKAVKKEILRDLVNGKIIHARKLITSAKLMREERFFSAYRFLSVCKTEAVES